MTQEGSNPADQTAAPTSLRAWMAGTAKLFSGTRKNEDDDWNNRARAKAALNHEKQKGLELTMNTAYFTNKAEERETTLKALKEGVYGTEQKKELKESTRNELQRNGKAESERLSEMKKSGTAEEKKAAEDYTRTSASLALSLGIKPEEISNHRVVVQEMERQQGVMQQEATREGRALKDYLPLSGNTVSIAMAGAGSKIPLQGGANPAPAAANKGQSPP